MQGFWDNNSHAIMSVFWALVILLATWVTVRLLRRWMNNFIRKKELSSDAAAVTKLRMIQRIGTVAIWLLGGALALFAADIPSLKRLATGLLASAGVAGIAMGIAAKTTVSNLISGIMISFVQPLRLGDRVEVGQDLGIVEEIGLFYTSIRTWDNRRVLIPNDMLASNVIRNDTVKDPRAPAVATFRFVRGADIDRLRSLMLESARGEPFFLENPDPTVQVMSVDDAGITVRLVAWAASPAQAADFSALLREKVLKDLVAAGLAASMTQQQPVGGPSGGAQSRPGPAGPAGPTG
jgi:small conductance mechanosensitive channel